MNSNLTPVKVRGKRKTPSAPTIRIPQELEKRLRVQHEFQIQAPGSQDQSPKKLKRSMAEIMARRTIQHRSTLDSLPSEILEKILLYSTNLALPRTSPLIGLRLSERATLVRLFILAFHETWDQWFGSPVSEKEEGTFEGNPELQTAILTQRWASIDLILTAQQAWVDRYASDRSFQHSVPWDDSKKGADHSHEGDDFRYNAHDCFEVDYQRALEWTPFQIEPETWGGHDIHPQVKIPTELMTGPWDDEKLRRLFWLSRGGMRISEDETDGPPWEDKIKFLRNAVLEATEPNVLVVNCLMGSWVFRGLPGDVMRMEKGKIDARLQWGDDTEDTRMILRRTRQALDIFLDHWRADQVVK
ncbi:hypothetical protein V2G26_016829 [Clonostachys chloroleuca]